MSTENIPENDPEQEDAFQVGADNDAPNNNQQPAGTPLEETSKRGAKKSAQKAQPKETATPQSVASRLSEHEAGDALAEEQQGEARAEDALPFDFSKLTNEQIQILQERLNATPARARGERRNPRILVPVIDGKYVTDFGRAYLALVSDRENRREVERQHVDVKLDGENDWRSILYHDFMQAERKSVEITSTRREVDEKVVGETFSREKGTMVEMTVRKLHDYFTVQLDDNRQIEIKADIANA